jgi:hypothetical protein
VEQGHFTTTVLTGTHAILIAFCAGGMQHDKWMMNRAHLHTSPQENGEEYVLIFIYKIDKCRYNQVIELYEKRQGIFL